MPPLDDRMTPTGEELAAVLDRLAGRIRVAHALRTAGTACLASAIVTTVAVVAGARPLPTAMIVLFLSLMLSAVWLFFERRAWTHGAAAILIERAHPKSRNVIITAAELMSYPERAAPWMCARVFDDAIAVTRMLDAARLVPLGRSTALCAAAAIGLIAVTLGSPVLIRSAARGVSSSQRGVAPASEPAKVTLVATIQPPGYTSTAVRTFTNPGRLDVIEGSRLRLGIAGAGIGIRVRFSGESVPVTVEGKNATANMVLTRSGYFAIESASRTWERRLLPVAVTPDRSPVVRIQQPGKDLLIGGSRKNIGLAASATDDFGLQSLELRYTKVSGSGEQFEFLEGTLPLEITRDSERAWNGRGAIPLPRLGLEPGDSLVYRVVARDKRPGDTGLAASETFFIEVAGPGQVALEGFELPPDSDRYALSQQMIVLKIQRLRAREFGLSRDVLERESSTIAAEQRAVRANFIFLMGGQIEDEEQEAAQSHEIQEGRLENTARREINSAIMHMTHADQALIATDTGKALPAARAGVEALQRAFGRNRYILRTLPVRGRVDPSRRLLGDLAKASGWNREVQPAAADRSVRDARDLLATVLELAPAVLSARARESASSFTALAERALAADPGAAEWQEIGNRLLQARDAVSSGRSDEEIRRSLQRVVEPLISLSRRGSIPSDDSPASSDALRSTWADEVRRR